MCVSFAVLKIYVALKRNGTGAQKFESNIVDSSRLWNRSKKNIRMIIFNEKKNKNGKTVEKLENPGRKEKPSTYINVLIVKLLELFDHLHLTQQTNLKQEIKIDREARQVHAVWCFVGVIRCVSEHYLQQMRLGGHNSTQFFIFFFHALFK